MTKRERVNVLVTGLGPYPTGGGGRIDENISHTLTRLLPSHLAPNTAINPSPNGIKILTLRSYIKTEYGYIRRFFQELYGTVPRDVEQHDLRGSNEHESDLVPDVDINNIDVIIHLGEARGWNFMSIERMAFKQGFTSSWWGLPPRTPYYELPDDKGQTVDDIGPSPWDDVPTGLSSALDIDAIAEGANAILQNRSRFTKKLVSSSVAGSQTVTSQTDDLKLMRFLHPQFARDDSVSEHTVDRLPPETKDTFLDSPIEVKPHREGGFYCCGFTNYESLANCYATRRIPNVLFCHVPGLGDERGLIWQKDGVLAVIVSAANEMARSKV